MSKLLTVFCFIFLAVINSVKASPEIGFNELMIQSELNPQVVLQARQEAMRQNLPVNIMTSDKILIDVKSVENGQPVYAVITNPLNIYEGGYTAFYYEIIERIDLSHSRIYYGNNKFFDNTGGKFTYSLPDNVTPSKYLMITDWTFDRVYLFSAQNGDLLDTAYIPRTAPQLQSPRHALQHPNGKQILVADQLSDLVQRFDSGGAYIGPFAPATGVNNAILDNIRGIRFRANNNLLVTVGSGTSQNTIQEFDTAGNHLGVFINSNLSSPFYILMRANDMLVSNSTAPNDIARFTLDGVFLSNFYAGANIAFPQETYQMQNGLMLVAGFSSPSGVVVLDTSGNYIKTLNAVTGNRGVYLLGNGHYLTTNSSGVHEIDSASGALIRTVTTGTSFQFISELNDIELTLTINFEACNVPDTIMVELRHSVSPYNVYEYSTGVAGQNSPAEINFLRARNLEQYYLAIKHRNSVQTWSANTQAFSNDALSYDFTSSASQAYGNNMVNVSGEWSLFTGDVNQDGIVDGADAGLIDNDSFNFVTGYVVTDLNCDNIVDGGDAAYCDNNSFNFVGSVLP